VSQQDLTTVSIDSLTAVTGAGSGACEDGPPASAAGWPRAGAGAIAGAVYTDTGKLPTPPQMQGAERSLTLGRNWTDVCARIRSERVPGWQP
jgi:hypothetical protein